MNMYTDWSMTDAYMYTYAHMHIYDTVLLVSTLRVAVERVWGESGEGGLGEYRTPQ